MDFLKTRYILLLISFTLIVGGGIGVLLHYVFPAYFPQWFEYSLLFMFLYSLLQVIVVEKKSKTLEPRKLVNLYLLMKVGKILVSLIYVAVYAIVVKNEIKKFALIFVSLYFIFMVFDTYYLFRIERYIKEKKKV